MSEKEQLIVFEMSEQFHINLLADHIVGNLFKINTKLC